MSIVQNTCKGSTRKVSAKLVDCIELEELFLSFPRTLYRDDLYWVPPIESSERELLGFVDHPFYEQAESQAFVVFRDGEVCGRVLAIIHHASNDWHDERHGSFGYFESIDDQEIANALFDAAIEWLDERECSLVRGPVNPAITYQGGLLVQKFDRSPTFLIPYNPSYYVELIERYGFRTAQDIYSFTGHVRMLDNIDPKIQATCAMAIERLGVTMRCFDMDRLEEEVALFYDFYNRCLKDMWGYAPVTDSEIRYASQTWREMIVPEFTSIAEIDGTPVAIGLGILDFNPLIKAAAGKTEPEPPPDISTIKRLQLPCTLVLPEYTYWGLGPAVLNNMLDASLGWGIEEVEFTWIAESNRLSLRTLERGGAQPGPAHRIYEFQIDAIRTTP